MLLAKEPVPDPSVVLELAVVGLAEEPQHTPRAVTAAPPSDVTVPPPTAPMAVLDPTAAVVTVGGRQTFITVVVLSAFP